MLDIRTNSRSKALASLSLFCENDYSQKILLTKDVNYSLLEAGFLFVHLLINLPLIIQIIHISPILSSFSLPLSSCTNRRMALLPLPPFLFFFPSLFNVLSPTPLYFLFISVPLHLPSPGAKNTPTIFFFFFFFSFRFSSFFFSFRRVLAFFLLCFFFFPPSFGG